MTKIEGVRCQLRKEQLIKIHTTFSLDTGRLLI